MRVLVVEAEPLTDVLEALCQCPAQETTAQVRSAENICDRRAHIDIINRGFWSTVFQASP